MHFLKHTSILLAVSAVYATLHPRMDPCEQEVEDNEQVELDGPTTDGTAGIGAEFECATFNFKSEACSKADTDAAKRKVVAGRTGTNFMLTADTADTAGKLNAEYILDGQNIKVGSGDAARAGAAAAQDLVAWQPWKADPPSNVDVADNNCNPWTVDSPPKSYNPDDLEWDTQITAPMPLEALYSLMKEQLADPPPENRNILNGAETGRVGNLDGENLIVVTQDYFQSNKNGIDESTVSDDVLGFCSLVLSYAKGAKYTLGQDSSPKLFLTFMPRTEFNTIYQQVKSKIPGDLFTLFDSLACYKTENDDVVIDTDYCSGTSSSPVSKNNFGNLKYSNSVASVNVKSWIQGIGVGAPSPDLLSAFDASIDGSIGGLGTKMEKMYNSQRSVPLFEFRDLYNPPPPSKFESFMANVDSAIQALHQTFANPSQRRKRQAAVSCMMTNGTFGTSTTATPTTTTVPATITPPPVPSCVLHKGDPDEGNAQAFCVCDNSITLTPLPVTAYGESCAYTSIPGSTAMETLTTQTDIWTTNCAACTLVGGILGQETCTTVAACTPTAAPTPTIAAWVGNMSTIDIGNADDGNGGKDLGADMFKKLKDMCSDSGCTGDHAEMDDVEAIIADGEEPLKPAMYLQGAQYTNQTVLEQMLSVGIASWIAVLNNPSLNLCKNVTYEADADETGSGCGKGPITPSRLRRKLRRDTTELLWERGGLAFEERQLAERCSDSCDPPMVCHYEARMCSAPNEITVVMAGAGDPYANHLNIGVTLDSTSDGFSCEEIAEELTAAMVILAPELLEADALDGIELEAICGIIDNPESILDNLKSTAQVSRRGPRAIAA